MESLTLFADLNLANLATITGSSFILITVAEIGDKSQLVCMTLAARHRATPVILGAIAAFALLNTLAVVFGSSIANWLPDYIVSTIVALLFAFFGIHAISIDDEEDEEEIVEQKGHNIFLTTFLLITVAEFGDKTQLAVVALSSTSLPIAVWMGSTAALIFTSSLGVLAGRTVLQKCPLSLLHKVSGLFFLVLAILAGYNAYLLFPESEAFYNFINSLPELIK